MLELMHIDVIDAFKQHVADVVVDLEARLVWRPPIVVVGLWRYDLYPEVLLSLSLVGLLFEDVLTGSVVLEAATQKHVFRNGHRFDVLCVGGGSEVWAA